MPAVGSAFYLEEISSAKMLKSLEAAWRELWERCETASIFGHPRWILEWWEHFGGGEIMSYALHYDGRLVAIAPMYRTYYDELKQVFFIGTGISDHLDLLAEPGFEIPAVEIILDRLVKVHGNWDRCKFEELGDGSSLLRAVMPYGLDGWIRKSAVCPVVQLPAKVEKFYESLNSTHRRKVLKAKRQLRDEIGEIEFSKAQELNYGQYLNDLFRLHEAAWKARHKSGVLSDSRVQSFHQSLCKSFIENGHACLYKLKAGNAVVSVVYGFVAKDRYYSYIGGFDPEYARYSPGNVILLHVMEDCINNGIKEFDFLRGSELYKYAWGAIDRPNFELTIE